VVQEIDFSLDETQVEDFKAELMVISHALGRVLSLKIGAQSLAFLVL